MTGTRIVITTIVSIILATAVSAGVLFAVENESGESNVSKLATKVAQILGLDENTVDDAINQARRELRDEAVQSGTSLDGKRSRVSRLRQPDKEMVQARLKAAVDAGTITQEQADQRLGAWAGRSKDTKIWGGKKARGKHFGPKITLEGLEKKLKALVDAGEMTKQEYDEKLDAIKNDSGGIKTWGDKKARGKKFGPKITADAYLEGLEKKLKASVAAGEITQQQADEKLDAIKEKAN